LAAASAGETDKTAEILVSSVSTHWVALNIENVESTPVPSEPCGKYVAQLVPVPDEEKQLLASPHDDEEEEEEEAGGVTARPGRHEHKKKSAALPKFEYSPPATHHKLARSS
jgi:hypothetical protein